MKSAIISLSIALLLSGCFAASNRPQEPAADESAATRAPIIERIVCFRVTVPTDLTPGQPSIATTGTWFEIDAAASPTRAVLLFHGGASDRTLWDGSSVGYGLENETTIARLLARAGYAVFTVDRLGQYGGSPYEGMFRHGSQLRPEAFYAQFSQTIAQLRQGTFSTTESTCASPSTSGREFSQVVLGGHSIAAAMSRAYTHRFQDVDGLISMGYVDGGPANPQLTQNLAACAAMHPPDPQGYAYAFCNDVSKPDRPVLNCVPLQMNPAFAEPAVLEKTCHRTTKRGAPPELLAAGESADAGRALASWPDIPVFLMYGENDLVVNGPEGDDSLARDEAARWKAECSCQVTSFVQPGAGHMHFFQTTYVQTNDVLLEWLRSF